MMTLHSVMSLPHPRLTRRTRALTWLAAALIALPGFGVPHAASADEADAPEEPAVRRVGVEEIVVTARKREERLQDTPVSVTALTADKIDSYQLTDLSQISLLTPNLSFDSSAPLTGSSSSSSIYIRGIGSSEFSLATEPGVGMYVDGVYLARSIGGVLDLVDPARIEVLRGPQGTLFGRNTIGGAIHIVSKRPEPELGGSARITLGSDSLSRWEGMLNVPVNETVRMRGSFMRTKQGGYVSDRTGTISDAGDKDSWAARTTLEWLPTDQVAVTLRADVTRERQGPAPNVLVALNPDGPPDTNTGMPTRSFVGGLIDLTCVGLGVPGPGFAGCQSAVLGGLQQQLLNGPFATAGGFVTGRPEVNAAASQPLSPKTELDIWGTSATVDWELTSELSVRAISSYRRLDTFFNLDIDHSGLPILQDVNDFDSDQTAHELQLNGQAMEGRLTYTVGGYYFLENGDNKDVVEFLPGALLSGGKFRNQGTAGFGQMTYSVTERLQVTLGARYSYEKKVFDTARQRVLVDFVAPGPDGMLAPIPDPAFMAGADLVTAENKSTNRDRALTPHLSVAYFFADDVMTYVSYSEGFKAGGFQQRIFPARPFASSFDKETAQVYELGVKATLLDSTMSVAAATFFTKYDDLQIAVAEGIAPILTNAGEAQIKGYEVEMQYRPLPELGIDVVLGFTDAQYAQIDPSRTGVGRGNKLVNTPRWSAGAGVSYRADLGPRLGAATAQVSWSFRDDVENDAFNTPELSEDQVNTYDAALTWESPSTNWRVTLAGRNLTDRTYIVSGSNVPLAGVVEAAYARGRTWQVSVERSF